MSTFQELKASFRRRLLTVANSHLLGPLETSLTGYEEEIGRRRRLLDLLRRTGCPAADFQHPGVPAEQQGDQEDQQRPHVKEEQGNIRPVQRRAAAVREDCGESQSAAGETDSDSPELESDADWDDVKHGRRSQRRRTCGKRKPAEDEAFSCSLCGQKFARRQTLRYHLKTHRGQRPFSCSQCPEAFLQEEHLKYHMLVHSGDRPYSCSLCDQTFRWPAQHKVHKCGDLSQRCRAKTKKPLSCSECGEMFPDRSLLTAHRKGHQEKHRFACVVCGLRARYRSQLKVHMRSHTGEKPYSCPVCGKKFTQIGITKQHMLVHATVKPFSCCDCDRKFSWHYQVTRHKCSGESTQPSRAMGSEPVSRGEPGRELNTDGKTMAPGEAADSDSEFWRETRQHRTHVTYQRNKKVFVSDTGRTTDRTPLSSTAAKEPENNGRSRPLTAEDSQTLQPQLSWYTCEENPLLEAELLSHRCVSESEIPANILFSCSVCADRFTTQEGLRLHLRRHTSCSVCNASFSDRDALVQHMRSHSKQTQFHCSLCGKDFAWRRHLTRHMELHKKNKLFRCTSCCRSFASQYRLHQHQLVRERCGGPESRDQTSDSSDPDTDDSDFWKEGGTHQLMGQDRDEAAERFSPQSDKARSDLTSVRPHEVSESEAALDRKTDILQWEVKQEEPQIKEEQEEADITELPFSCVPVKSEDDDDDEAQSSQLHHIRDSVGGQDCGGPGPGPVPGPRVGAASCQNDDSVDSDFWKEDREAQSGLNSDSDPGRNLLSCSASASLQPDSDDSDFWKDDRSPSSGLTASKHCEASDGEARRNADGNSHLRRHKEKRLLVCSVCGVKCHFLSHLKIHMRTHTGEKPFSCPICGKKYAHKASVQSHMVVHTMESQYSCRVCERSFGWYTELKYHQCVAKPWRETP